MIDVVIIGGGVIGCSVARELSRRELSIVLLEKAADICDGQSKANTGIIHAGYDAEPGSNKAKFNVLGNAMFDDVCAELDVPYKWNTSLVVSFNSRDDHKLNALLERGLKNGVKRMKIIGRDEILRREPNISQNVSSALLLESGGMVCPYELTIANAEIAALNGVEFRRNTCVSGIQKISGPNGGWRVLTDSGVFDAKAVVNCAGVRSDEINNMVSEDKHHIRARRGEYYIVDKKYADMFRATIFQLPDDMGKGVVVTPTVDGTLLVGPTSEDIDDKDDKDTTKEGLEKALRKGSLTWENIPRRGFITTFSGLRAHCDKDDFVIGEAPDAPMFFNALGVESPGIASSPAIARHLADLISEKLNAAPNKKFKPERRGIPKFRDMSDDEKIRAIAFNPEYAKIVCRCENVTEAEVRSSIRRPVGARTLDGIKLRVRAGMGRCQAGFCTSRTIEIMCEELGIDPLQVTKSGPGSELLTGYLFDSFDSFDSFSSFDSCKKDGE